MQQPTKGVVHANVGQKLLFCYLVRVFWRVFFLSGFVFVTQLLVDATDFSNWLLFGHLLSYPSSASVQLDHLTACGQFDMSYP